MGEVRARLLPVGRIKYGVPGIEQGKPPTPPEKHTGKGEEKALTEAIRNTAVPQHGANNCFPARRSVFLDRGPLNGDPMPETQTSFL
jgi:hypothetical protein